VQVERREQYNIAQGRTDIEIISDSETVTFPNNNKSYSIIVKHFNARKGVWVCLFKK
jgi:hypothetical protein